MITVLYTLSRCPLYIGYTSARRIYKLHTPKILCTEVSLTSTHTSIGSLKRSHHYFARISYMNRPMQLNRASLNSARHTRMVLQSEY